MGVLRGVGIAGIVVGALLVIAAGIIGWVVVPNIVDSKIKEETRLMSDSDTWGKWVDISFPIKLKFHIYGIQNPGVLLNPSEITEKIRFVERGPYVYNEHRYKVDVGIDEEGQVRYKQKIDYYFNREESVGSEDEVFSIPNIPLISVATAGFSRKTEEELVALRMLLSLLTSNISTSANETLIKNATVRQILFEGWPLHDHYKLILQSPADFPPEFGDPAEPTFGIYSTKNGTDDGEFVIRSGAQRHEEFGQTVTWTRPGLGWVDGVQYPYNASAYLDWWYSDSDLNHTFATHCNKINGSADGSLHPPFNTKDTVLQVFQAEICRSVYLPFSEEVEFLDIPGYRYTLEANTFASSVSNGDNECFCPNPSPRFPDRLAHECVGGTMRIFPCKNGAPIVVSNIHFMHADDSVYEAIELDVQPDVERDTTYLDIEPDSGMVLRASKKIQINVELQNLAIGVYQEGLPIFFNDINFKRLTDQRSILLPVVWAEETVELDEEAGKELYDKLIKPQKIVTIAKWTGIGVGVVLFLVGILAVYKGGIIKKKIITKENTSTTTKTT